MTSSTRRVCVCAAMATFAGIFITAFETTPARNSRLQGKNIRNRKDFASRRATCDPTCVSIAPACPVPVVRVRPARRGPRRREALEDGSTSLRFRLNGRGWSFSLTPIRRLLGTFSLIERIFRSSTHFHGVCGTPTIFDQRTKVLMERTRPGPLSSRLSAPRASLQLAAFYARHPSPSTTSTPSSMEHSSCRRSATNRAFQ